ncbi:MAG: hypothetical protein CBB71_15050 [Rhodopirellula sp. TMED11]|nr:MAG: hypothetical protein CBB71_15050 [Rhodopirellula sp. TMED11]
MGAGNKPARNRPLISGLPAGCQRVVSVCRSSIRGVPGQEIEPDVNPMVDRLHGDHACEYQPPSLLTADRRSAKRVS